MKNWILKLLIPAILLCATDSYVHSQKMLQVLTKTIDKKIKYEPGDGLLIEAEKASIEIEGWDKNYIGLKIELISKHPKKETAEKELAFLKYDIEKTGSDHIVKNYFQTDKQYTNVKGNLITRYIIKVPKNCDISVTNLYGSLAIANLQSDLTAHLRFVDFDLKKSTSDANLESYFGKIRIDGFTGTLKAKLEKTDINLITFVGDLELTSQYGSIDILGGTFKRFVINGDRTEINFDIEQLERYNYDLKTLHASIHVPNIIGEVNNTDDLQGFNKIFKGDNPMVKIHTRYSPITVKLLFNASGK